MYATTRTFQYLAPCQSYPAAYAYVAQSYLHTYTIPTVLEPGTRYNPATI